jgi:hypothetical protein
LFIGWAARFSTALLGTPCASFHQQMDGNVMQSNDALIEVEGRSKAKVFISYSRKDMAFADRLEAVLRARGFEPLIDRTAATH